MAFKVGPFLLCPASSYPDVQFMPWENYPLAASGNPFDWRANGWQLAQPLRPVSYMMLCFMTYPVIGWSHSARPN
jgi:hypothetical protein